MALTLVVAKDGLLVDAMVFSLVFGMVYVKVALKAKSKVNYWVADRVVLLVKS